MLVTAAANVVVTSEVRALVVVTVVGGWCSGDSCGGGGYSSDFCSGAW